MVLLYISSSLFSCCAVCLYCLIPPPPQHFIQPYTPTVLASHLRFNWFRCNINFITGCLLWTEELQHKQQRQKWMWSVSMSVLNTFHTACVSTSDLLFCLTLMDMLLNEHGSTPANQQLHVHVETDVFFFYCTSLFHLWLYQIVLRCAVFLTSCQAVWSLPCSSLLSWFNQWNVSLTRTKLQVEKHHSLWATELCLLHILKHGKFSTSWQSFISILVFLVKLSDGLYLSESKPQPYVHHSVWVTDTFCSQQRGTNMFPNCLQFVYSPLFLIICLLCLFIFLQHYTFGCWVKYVTEKLYQQLHYFCLYMLALNLTPVTHFIIVCILNQLS